MKIYRRVDSNKEVQPAIRFKRLTLHLARVRVFPTGIVSAVYETEGHSNAKPRQSNSRKYRRGKSV